MNEHDLQNEKFERIERRLFKTAKLSGDEIEKIVAAPRLFDSVLAKIETEKRLKQKPERVSALAAIRVFLYRQKAFAACGILVFLLIGAALFTFKKTASPEFARQIATPETAPKFAPLENAIQPPEFEQTKIRETKKRVRGEKTILRSEKPKISQRARTQTSANLRQNPKTQQTEVFYSLTPFGTWDTNGEILQIVRAEISRAELFALGVNLAVENESEKVKTDLLVGDDGVARAFRLVE